MRWLAAERVDDMAKSLSHTYARILLAALALAMVAIYLFPMATALAEQPEKTGYWEFVKDWTDKTENDPTNPDYACTLEGSASAGFHAKEVVVKDGYRFSYTNLDERAHKGTSCKGEFGEVTITYSPLPSARLEAGQKLAITATVMCNTVAHVVGVSHQAFISWRMDDPESNNYYYLRTDTPAKLLNGGDDLDYIIAGEQMWTQEGKGSGGYSSNMKNRTAVYTTTIPKGGEYEGEDLYIRFEFQGRYGNIRSYYQYRWVDTTPVADGATSGGTNNDTTGDGTTDGGEQDTDSRKDDDSMVLTLSDTGSDEDEEPFTPDGSILQTKETDADFEPGSTSTGFLSEIVEGFGIDGILRLAAIAGVVLIGVATVRNVRRLKGAESKTASGESAPRRSKDDGQKENKEPSKQYRMVFSKDFGNLLRPGAPAREVCVRIEESTDGATFHPNQQLTSVIEVHGLNLDVVGTPVMRGVDMVARISVPRRRVYPTTLLALEDVDSFLASPENQPLLRLIFRGAHGTLINNVKFKLIGDPTIVFVDRNNKPLAIDSHRVDVLMDEKDTECFFVARNFLGRPADEDVRLESSSADLLVRWERDPRLDAANAYGFRAFVRTTRYEPCDYGSWPIQDSHLTVSVSNPKDQELAEAEAGANLWPEGISFDTKLVKPSWVKYDRIVVDTSDYDTERASEYRIPRVDVGICVAYRDRGLGDVHVEAPDVGRQMIRLEGADVTTFDLFAEDPPRLWYDLRLLKNPTSKGDPRTGTLSLQVLFPLVTARPHMEYHGVFHVQFNPDRGLYPEGAAPRHATDLQSGSAYDPSKPSFGNTIHFGVTGLFDDDYDRELYAEKEKIFKLLGTMQLTNLTFADKIFQQYGPESENLRRHLGSYDIQASLGNRAERMIRRLNDFQSVQRLRFIRKELYKEAVWYCENEGGFESTFGWDPLIKAKGLVNGVDHMSYAMYAEFYDTLLSVTQTNRWIADIAFTAWFYRCCGTKATYIEPVATPLKDWFLEYCGQFGLAVWDEKESLQRFTEFFAPERWFDKLAVPALENELLAMFVEHAKTGGVGLLADPRTYTALGLVLCFLFATECRKRSKYNEGTDRDEVDLWGALRDTMRRFTAFTVKTFFAVLIARLFSPSQAVGDGGFAARFTNNTWYQQAKDLIWDKMLKGTLFKDGSMLSSCLEKAKAMIMGIDKDVAATLLLATSDKVVSYETGTEASQNPVPSDDDFDRWVKGLGEVDVLVPASDGMLQAVKLPYFTVVMMVVDIVFESSGIESLEMLQIDYDKVLPADCPHLDRKELIEGLRGIRGKSRAIAEAEADFVATGKASAGERKLPATLGSAGNMSSDLLNMQR